MSTSPSETRHYTIKDTRLTSIYFANPEAANPYGTVHGGRIMRWMTATGYIASQTVSRGQVLLAHVDDVFFISPVYVGNVLRVSSWIEYIGNSSMEVGVEVLSEDPLSGSRRVNTLSHMVFVAVDPNERPRRVPAVLRPSRDEEELVIEAEKRRGRRLHRIEERREKLGDTAPYAPGARWRAESTRMVFPDDAVYKGIMFAGRLLHLMDEHAAYVASSFAKQVCVTASVDSVDFYCPIYVGDFLETTAVLTYVGRSSAEVGLKVIRRSAATGERMHVGMAYYTFVAMKGRETKGSMPPYVPETEEEKRLFMEGEERRRSRLERLEQFKSQLSRIGSLR